jgi:hypothetical protein
MGRFSTSPFQFNERIVYAELPGEHAKSHEPGRAGEVAVRAFHPSRARVRAPDALPSS